MADTVTGRFRRRGPFPNAEAAGLRAGRPGRRLHQPYRLRLNVRTRCERKLHRIASCPVGMPKRTFSTWGASRGNRLPPESYVRGLPIHVQICTRSRYNAFLDPPLAAAVFKTVRLWPGTLAACLMPDHLHWLLWRLDTEFDLPYEVKRFKSWTTRTAWQLNWNGTLWQRSYWDHVVRTKEGVRRVAVYIVGNPVRAGLTDTVGAWPHAVLFEERFPDEI